MCSIWNIFPIYTWETTRYACFFFMILTHLKSPINFLNYIPIICEAISGLASSLPSKHMLRYDQSLPSIPGKSCFTPHRRKIQESFFGWWFQPTQLKNMIVKLIRSTCQLRWKIKKNMFEIWNHHLPGTQMSLVLIGKGLLLEGWSPKSKTGDKQVPGSSITPTTKEYQPPKA